MECRTLEIVLQSATDLNKVNLITKMDIFAVVSIYGGDATQVQKTKSPVDHVGGDNPIWNFPMKFTIDEAGLQSNQLKLDFKLVCQRALGDKDVGDVHVPLKELFDSQSNPVGADGKRIERYQVRKPSGKPKGQLTFSYQFSEKTVSAAAPLPYGSTASFALPPGKVDAAPVTAYAVGPSSGYPPQGVYPPPAAQPGPEGGAHYPPPGAHPKVEESAHYPPPAGYPQSGGPGGYPPPAPGAYGYPPTQGYGYPQPGYGYPPQPGYGYPPQPGYGYAAPPVQQLAPKKNKFGGLGLGAGLLGGAIGGLLIGDMVSDAADFDGGFDF